MQSFIQGRSLAIAVAVLQLFMQVMVFMPSRAWAQDVDTDPPVIDFKPVVEGVKGDSQVFTATVTDDQEVASVFINYRLDNESVYQDRQMESLGTTGIYSTTISAKDDVTVIQYYIEAKDAAGNRTLQGFAFDPLERQLVERLSPAVQAQTDAIPATGMSTGRKILYGVLGVVVVGALAAAAGGGGSDGGSNNGVGVTIEVEPLP